MPMPDDARARTSRFAGLDGLRGIAALVVLIHHVLLSDPGLADAYLRHTSLPPAQKAITYTPLHLFWAGSEAVLVFFVLSGFVLSAGVTNGHRPRWLDYYPRRLLRLYLPVLAALALALPQGRWLRPSSPDHEASWVYNASGGLGTFHNLLHDGSLAHRKATFLDGPLWSLHWEVLYSLALPAYLLLLTVRRRSAALLAATVLLLLTAFGVRHGSDELTFLPVFGLGVLAAGNQAALGDLARRWSSWIVAAGGLLLTTQWTVTGFRDPSPTMSAATTAAAVVGAAFVTVGFLSGTVARWAGEDPRVRWLGRRSFSLYLTHAPIIVSTAYLLGGHPPVWLLLVLCVPAALLVAELFGRFVEEPAHDLSKRVGRWVVNRRDSPTSVMTE